MALAFRRRTAVVNLVTGKSFLGELLITWPWQVKLHRPDVVDGPNTAPVKTDGNVVVPRRVIEFVQYVD